MDRVDVYKYKPMPDAQLHLFIGSQELYDLFKTYCARIRANHDNVKMSDVKRYMQMTSGMLAMNYPQYTWHYQYKKISAMSGVNMHILWYSENPEQVE